MPDILRDLAVEKTLGQTLQYTYPQIEEIVQVRNINVDEAEEELAFELRKNGFY